MLTNERSEAAPLSRLPEFRLALRHGKLGLITAAVGLVLFAAVVAAHSAQLPALPEYAWGAILSIPVTILCSGLFSVFYELYMRATFLKSMRALIHSWDSGVTVYPTHKDAPDRKAVLESAKRQVRLLSTTFFRYFTDVRDEVRRKAASGVEFKFIIYDPSSKALEEKAKEEGHDVEDFRDEIRSTCRRDLGLLVRDFPGRVQVRFCPFNAPFGITIVDEAHLVLSLNIYGMARSKNQTPCLIIENRYDPESVFKLYETSFDAIWNKLEPNRVPDELRQFFGVSAT